MLSPLEQEVLNVLGLAEQVGAALVAANNPSYAPIISTLGSAVSSGVSTLTPGVAAPASTLAQDVVSSVIPSASAINTLGSKTASSAQKAAAVTTLLTTAETIGEDVWSAISAIFVKKVTTPAPAAS